jgi:hypothetical protein
VCPWQLAPSRLTHGGVSPSFYASDAHREGGSKKVRRLATPVNERNGDIEKADKLEAFFTCLTLAKK